MRFTALKGERSKLSETICENNFVLTDEQISGVVRPQPPSRRARLASWLLFKSLSVESIKLTPLFSNASCSLFFNRFHFHVKWRLEFSRNFIEGRSTTPVLKSFHWLHLARCKHRKLSRIHLNQLKVQCEHFYIKLHIEHWRQSSSILTEPSIDAFPLIFCQACLFLKITFQCANLVNSYTMLPLEYI